MTTNRQNEVLAAFIDRRGPRCRFETGFVFHESDEGKLVERPFTESRDSIALLEAVLSDDEWDIYRDELWLIVRMEKYRQTIDIKLMRSTPEQRCEALLKALGLWEND